MVWYPPIGALTSLPLCGEWIVVQLNPAAMVKHLDHRNAPQLVEEYSKLPLYPYLAVFRRYLETPSEKKPWHLCELFIVSEMYIETQKRAAAAGKRPSIIPLDEAEAKDKRFPHRNGKESHIFQSIYARIRTRVSPLPRGAPYLVPEETWSSMKDQLMVRGRELTPLPVECRKSFLKRADNPETQPLSIDDDNGHEIQMEWDEAHRPGICLLPHFDYSFDLSEQVAQAKHWEEEHAFVIKRLLAMVPSMPRVAKIPIRCVEIRGRKWYQEHPKSRDPRLALMDRFGSDDDHEPAGWQPPPPGALVRASEHVLNFVEGCVQAFKGERKLPPGVQYRFLEKAYEYQVEEPADTIWAKVPAVLMIHGEGESKQDNSPVKPPKRRQSIIPRGSGAEFIDEKFYVPFVDEVAVDLEILKDLENRSKYGRYY